MHPDEATAVIEQSRITVSVDGEAAGSRVGQIAAIVAVATASRAFGSVIVDLAHDEPLRVRNAGGRGLRDALFAAGGVEGTPTASRLMIGNQVPPDGSRGVRIVLRRSIGGVAPADLIEPFDMDAFAPAAILGASLAALDLFSVDVLAEPDGGRRRTFDLLPDYFGPVARLDDLLPVNIGFLGVGHLGQAALFAAALLGPVDDERTYFLFDDDKIEPANSSTQLLVRLDQTGSKVGACAEWLAARSIGAVKRMERFGPASIRQETDPTAYLVGFDNPDARRALDVLMPARVIDAGVGSNVEDFAAFRIHAFPQSRKPSEVFRAGEDLAEARARARTAEQFAAFARTEDEVCGLIEAGGVASAVPFVGTAIAAMTLSELIRDKVGVDGDALVSGDLRWLNVGRAVLNNVG